MTKFDKFYKTIIREAVQSRKPTTDAQKIAYIVHVLPIISPKNVNKTPQELTKQAVRLISNGMFDAIYDAHETRVAQQEQEPEPESMDVPEIPPETPLSGDQPTEEDIHKTPEAERFLKQKQEADIRGIPPEID